MWWPTKMAPSLRFITAPVLALALVMLGGCGFHLKKAADLPVEMTNMQLIASDSKSELATLLSRELTRSKVQLVERPNARTVRLKLFKDTLERRTLSLFKNGQVAEYELAYGVSYEVIRPGSEAVKKRFELYRNYQDDPDNALAKAKELDLILSEMRQQASRRILRELAQL